MTRAAHRAPSLERSSTVRHALAPRIERTAHERAARLARAVTYNAVSFAQGSFGTPTSFAADIRPFFRDKDIQAMRNIDYPIDLASYQDVKSHAMEIYDSVAHPTGVISMPCDGRWSTDWVDTFKLWMDSGMLP